ncbi:hypothetical protein, partial [Myxococcus sp. CA023]|uniref:hypothetical protein n=1 Tax=Myxococcus sp. CA023 TaxID=2651865 RepID=UPI001969DBEC
AVIREASGLPPFAGSTPGEVFLAVSGGTGQDIAAVALADGSIVHHRLRDVEWQSPASAAIATGLGVKPVTRGDLPAARAAGEADPATRTAEEVVAKSSKLHQVYHDTARALVATLSGVPDIVKGDPAAVRVGDLFGA